ncbi:MAG: sigma factor [Candidatus Pacearchaeota archaeon]
MDKTQKHKKDKKYYFDNDSITKAIRQYQKELKKGNDDISILYPYTKQIESLIRGVINTHKINRWWPDSDELVQEGMVAVLASLKRFRPSKGTAFNYLSIVAKQHLKNWTQSKNKKNWSTFELNEQAYLENTDYIKSAEDFILLEEMFHEVDVPAEIEPVLEAIMFSIVKEKIHNKRDIIKNLFARGFEKAKIDIAFSKLSEHFGEFVG